MPTVTITRRALGAYTATNESGATIDFAADGEFTAVELLLAALGGCSGVDVDYLTSRRAEPEQFEIEVSADKVKDPNRLENVTLTVRVRFGADGDAAREVLPKAVQMSHDRLCTVGQSLERPTPVTTRIE